MKCNINKLYKNKKSVDVLKRDREKEEISSPKIMSILKIIPWGFLQWVTSQNIARKLGGREMLKNVVWECGERGQKKCWQPWKTFCSWPNKSQIGSQATPTANNNNKSYKQIQQKYINLLFIIFTISHKS